MRGQHPNQRRGQRRADLRRDYPDAIAVSPNGQRVYVANYADATLSVIDTVSRSAVAQLATGGGPAAIALSPGGATSVNAIDSTVSAINTAAVAAPGGRDCGFNGVSGLTR